MLGNKGVIETDKGECAEAGFEFRICFALRTSHSSTVESDRTPTL
jgi:hypothetical protein